MDCQVHRAFFIQMTSRESLEDCCRQLASATRLQEGPDGVESLLRVIHRCQPISPKDTAAQLGWPIPLVSALRRELEKMGWLIRKGGMTLSAEAAGWLDSLWGSPSVPAGAGPGTTEPEDGNPESDEEDPYLEEADDEDSPSTLDYIPLTHIGSASQEEPDAFREMLEEIFEERPAAEPRWDQSHATIDTVLRRAELFIDHGYIQGKRILFLGDDDLTSLVSLLMVRQRFGEAVLRGCSAVVVEIDPNLVEFIGEMALGEDLPLAVLQGDLRDGLPRALADAMDFFFTDPPYTPNGVDLFLSRGCQALAPQGSRKGCLAVPLSPPELQQSTQKSLIEKGFVIDYLDPFFNEYLGATMQGGVSALYGLTQIRSSHTTTKEGWGNIYTAGQKKKNAR